MATLKKWLKKLVPSLRETNQPNTPAKPTLMPVPFTFERHKVAGISFRTEALLSIGTKNPDYDLTWEQLIEEGLTDERVYRTEFYPNQCEVIPEPINPEDPHAIKVLADGVHIGYIKKGSCAHIYKLLREGRVVSISCDIGGGAYKFIQTTDNEVDMEYDEDDMEYDEDDMEYDEDESENYTIVCDKHGKEFYNVKKDSIPYHAVVIIKVKNQA